MATFFGEILPVISRAVDSDEDDELAPEPKQLNFEWTDGNGQGLISCDTVILTVGEVAWRFAELHYGLSDGNKTAILKEMTEDEDDCGFEAVSKLPKIVASFYKVSDEQRNLLLVACKAYIPPEQLWPWTRMFFDHVKDFGEVFVLTSATIHEYKCEDINSVVTPIVRCLSTTRCPRSHPVFPTLEQPNMLKNIPASVVSYCQFHDIPAAAYICYTENMHLDIPSVHAFTKLLETPQFKMERRPEVGTKRILQAIKNSNTSSGLYT